MTILHMQVEVVERTLQMFQRILPEMENLAERMLSAAPLGWWQGPAADEYEQRLRAWLSRYRRLIEEGETLMQQLEHERRQWIEAAQRLDTPAPTSGPVRATPEADVGVAVTAGSGAAVGAVVAAGAQAPTTGQSPSPSSGSSTAAPQPAQPPPSTYTPRFDGTKPAPGMDSTYGKPGQLPLDAVVKSTPNNRDPNLYQDVINQFAVGNNPRYAPIVRPGPNNDITFCNTFAGDVARAMGHPFPTKAEWGINPKDRATIGMPDLWRYFTDSKAPIRAADQGWKEIPVSNLQELERYVNSGKMAVVVTPDHIAVVRPNQRITDLASIRIAQAGAINANDIPLVKGFGQKRLGIVRIFVHD